MRISWVNLQRRLERRSTRDGSAGDPPGAEFVFGKKSNADAILCHLS